MIIQRKSDNRGIGLRILEAIHGFPRIISDFTNLFERLRREKTISKSEKREAKTEKSGH
jgi:hypothetical protein